MKSMLVIGMSKYGVYLAQKLQQLKNQVMVVDHDEQAIGKVSPLFPDALVADCTDRTVLESLGVQEFDVCFVAISEDFQASLEIASLLHELGAKKIVCKAARATQEKFLLQTGATEVVYPDMDIARRIAVKYSSDNIYDYIPIGDGYSIYEMAVKKSWVGQSIIMLNVRKNYGINIIAIRQADEDVHMPLPEYVFEEGDHIIVIVKDESIGKLENKLK